MSGLKRDENGYLDPIFEWEVHRWYFYDETWSHAYGPFDTRILAEAAFGDYCVNLLGPANDTGND